MGFEALAGVGAAASFFGSARTPPDDPDYELARETARIVGESGLAIITGGGPGLMEAANRGAQGRRRAVGRPQHRAAVRAGRQPLLRHRARVPLLLHAQDHVRPLRQRVRRLPGRLRHDGRALGGAHPDPDREDRRVPGRARRHRLLARADRLGRATACSARATSRRTTSTCSRSPTILRRCVTS